MTKREQLMSWLGDRQRKYADGLAIFLELAPEKYIADYAAYFKQVPGEIHQFDQHFTMLINKLSDIARNIAMSPSSYPKSSEEVITIQIPPSAAVKELSDDRNKKIEDLQTTITDLEARINELEDSEEDHASEIEELECQLELKHTELETLREELDKLNQPGVKIVTEASLPPSLQKAYARIKEIAPLYASLHNDVANPALTSDERIPLADNLCKLDDERRSLWKTIDKWSEGKEVQLEEVHPVYSDNQVVRGFEIARQIKRLTQNIANSNSAVDRAKSDGKRTVMQNALERVAKYEAELSKLQAEIAAEQTAS